MDYGFPVLVNPSTWIDLLFNHERTGAHSKRFFCACFMVGRVGAFSDAPSLVNGKVNPARFTTLLIDLNGGDSQSIHEDIIMSVTAIPNFSVCESTGKYEAQRQLTSLQIINAAKKLLIQQGQKGATFINSKQVRDYLALQYAEHKNEVFICMFLDRKHRLIKKEELFHGTINSAPVYTRVVVQRCLELNAEAVIFAHNHPSGDNTPSRADVTMTIKLDDALQMIDVRILDHLIIGAVDVYSFNDTGLLKAKDTGAFDGLLGE